MKKQIDTRNLTKSETLINNYSQHISDYLESNDFMRINLRYMLFISSVLTIFFRLILLAVLAL